MTQPEQDVANMQEGLITPEALEVFRHRIGIKLRIGNQFNELASKDAIRKFAYGIGDPNPLWRDEDYAAKTRYGCLIAPPSWPYSVYPTWVLQGLPGVHAFHSGNDWEFYRPILVGDKITPECIFTPEGMPITGTEASMTSMTSRAVPSPPVNSRRSTPDLMIAAQASLVSLSVVSWPGVNTTVRRAV